MWKGAGSQGPRPSKKPSARSRGAVKRLFEWATGEMKYTLDEEGSLSPEDLHTLARGELAEFWEYVVKHVKSPSNADVIRGNVFLHTADGAGDVAVGERGEGARVEREREKLTREEASLRMAVQQMQRDIAQLQENITQLDEAGDVMRGERSRLSRGSALLLAHSRVSRETSNTVDEYARRIRARIDVFTRPVDREAAYFTKQGMGEVGRVGEEAGPTLESACTHEVRIICSQLEEALSAPESQKLSDVKRGREHCWKQIESLLTHYSPADILCSLVEVTQQAAGWLHSHTAAIDLSRDAQQLKYSYDYSGMQDLSEEPSLLHAVEEQLLEAQLYHIRRSMESERAQKASSEAQRRAAELQAVANQLLQESYRDEMESGALELAERQMRLDLECAGSEASLEKLSLLCSSLGQTRDQRKKAIDNLQTQLRKIHDFAQVADSKQQRIQALVMHNSSAKDRLLKQSKELQVYIQQHIVSHRDEIHAVAAALQDSVAREVGLFAGLDLDRLLKPPSLEDTPTCDLSVNRLNTKQPSGYASYKTILLSLKLSPTSAPDRLLSKLLKIQEKVGSLDRNVANVNQMLQEMRVIAVNKDHTLSVLQSCGDHDRELLEAGIPALQEELSRASCGLAECDKTAETLEHWWVQPAQFLTPWATWEGNTYGEWVEQWTVLAAKFSELQQ